MYNFEFGKKYTFNTLAPSILGATIKNHTVRGVFDFNTACSFDNVMLKHRQIYPLLPKTVQDNPTSFKYVLLESEAGIKRIVADVWIDENSIIEVTEIKATIEIQSVTSSDVQRISESLTLMGIVNFTITTTEVVTPEA